MKHPVVYIADCHIFEINIFIKIQYLNTLLIFHKSYKDMQFLRLEEELYKKFYFKKPSNYGKKAVFSILGKYKPIFFFF